MHFYPKNLEAREIQVYIFENNVFWAYWYRMKSIELTIVTRALRTYRRVGGRQHWCSVRARIALAEVARCRQRCVLACVTVNEHSNVQMYSARVWSVRSGERHARVGRSFPFCSRWAHRRQIHRIGSAAGRSLLPPQFPSGPPRAYWVRASVYGALHSEVLLLQSCSRRRTRFHSMNRAAAWARAHVLSVRRHRLFFGSSHLRGVWPIALELPESVPPLRGPSRQWARRDPVHSNINWCTVIVALYEG